MSEQLIISVSENREERYVSLLPQVRALLQGEKNLVANAANLMAALKETFGFLWVGCYFTEKEELVLGPFQGPIACTRIHKGKGVCGTSWEKSETIIVPDVELFPGHIACSSLSRSEIVVPIKDTSGNVIGVIDMDSVHLNDFSIIDQKYLEIFAEILSRSQSE